jgi:RNA recognition motif-containing protein
MEIFINFVGPDATEKEIRDLFAPFGKMLSFRLMPAKKSFSGKCWIALESNELAK